MKDFKRKRLLELIEKKDVALSATYDLAYEWLEELHYLFSSLKELGEMGKKIMLTIKSLQNTEFEFLEDINLIKAQLEVFKKYEFESIDFS